MDFSEIVYNSRESLSKQVLINLLHTEKTRLYELLSAYRTINPVNKIV